MKPVFFSSPEKLRRWFEKNHSAASELLVGYYKKDTGKSSVTWPESVDEALCFGWIDGIRKSLDEESYTIRFTPRRAASNWSARNIERVKILSKQNRMRPAGLAAFHERTDDKSAVDSYEQAGAEFDQRFLKRIKSDKRAWQYFCQSATPYYRKMVIGWIMSAKQEETRLRRLAALITSSAQGEKLPQFLSPPKRKKK